MSLTDMSKGPQARRPTASPLSTEEGGCAFVPRQERLLRWLPAQADLPCALPVARGYEAMKPVLSSLSSSVGGCWRVLARDARC